jgi:hypothetical protein
MELTSGLLTCSSVLMNTNTNSLSFLLILFYYLWIISVVSHCITSCYAIICLEVPSIFVSQLNFRDMSALVSCEPSLTTLKHTTKRSDRTIATSHLKMGDKPAPFTLYLLYLRKRTTSNAGTYRVIKNSLCS